MLDKELCDLHAEEAASLARKKPIPRTPYGPGRGPNPNFHDTGVGYSKRIIKKEQKNV